MSDYAVIFGPNNHNWHGNVEISSLFLRTQENWFNDLLRARGHVFLNEVYGGLGIPHTPAGAVMGWSMANNEMQNRIEFETIEHPNGAIGIDFNVDGFILDKLNAGSES